VESAIECFQTHAEFQDAHESLMALLDEAEHDDISSTIGESAPRENEEKHLLRIMGPVKDFLKRGTLGGAYIHEPRERRGCQALLDYWATLCYGAGIDIGRPILAAPDAGVLPTLAESACPYVGLDAFDEGDARNFFGRAEQVSALAAKLQEERLVIVTGASGSGKSSLVLAGLIPALKAGAVPGSRKWRYLPALVPGTAPLLHLAQAVQPREADARAWAIEHSDRFLHDPGHLAALLSSNDEPALLVVDQFEEVLTMRTAETSEVYLRFVANLLQLVDTPQPTHRVIVTMRKDVESMLARDYPDLYRRYRSASFPVYSMESTHLRDVIEKPASFVGLKFQDGVVDELVKSVVGEDSSLPLLQFSLMALWDRRKGNLITTEAYREVGSPRQAMAEAARRLYDGLPKEQQLAAQKVFLSLSRFGEGATVFRARASRRELHRVADRTNVDRVLEKFESARLIRITRLAGDPEDDLAEVAHESLLRNWDLLSTLFSDQRIERERRAFLRKQAEKWREGAFNEAFLLSGIALKQANEEVDPASINKLEREFLVASETVEAARDARLRREARRALVAMFIAVAFAMVAVVQWWNAEGRRHTADARRLATNALVQASSNSDLSVLLALEAKQIEPAMALDVVPAIMEATRFRRPLWRLTPEQVDPEQFDASNRLNPRSLGRFGSSRALALSPDGKRLIIANRGSVAEWNVEKEPFPVRQLAWAESVRTVNFVSYSHDGSYLAAATDRGLSVWTAAGEKIPRGFNQTGALRRVEFSGDGRMLAAVTEHGGGLHVWSLPDGELLLSARPSAGDGGDVNSVFFDRASKTVVFMRAPKDGEMKLKLYRYRIANGRIDPVPETVDTEECKSVAAYAASGGRIGMSQNPLICTYDTNPSAAAGGNSISKSTERQMQLVDDIVFSGDGRFVVKLLRSNSEASILDFASGETARLQGAFDLDEQSSYEGALSISANGTRFAIQGKDGSVRGFQLGEQSRRFREYGKIDRISPDGKKIIAPSYKDGVLGHGLWDVVAGSLQNQLDATQFEREKTWLSSDGKFLIGNKLSCTTSTDEAPRSCVAALPVDGGSLIEIPLSSSAGRTEDLVLVQNDQHLRVYSAGIKDPIFEMKRDPALGSASIDLGAKGVFAVKRVSADQVSVEVYKFENGKARLHKALPSLAAKKGADVSFSGDARFIVVKSEMRVRVWDLAKAAVEPVLDQDGVRPEDIFVPAKAGMAISRKGAGGQWEIRDLDRGGDIVERLPGDFRIDRSGAYAWGHAADKLEIRSLRDIRAKPLPLVVDAQARPRAFASSSSVALVEFPREGRARVYEVVTGKVLTDMTLDSIAPPWLSENGQYFVDKYQRLIPTKSEELFEAAKVWVGRPFTVEERCILVDANPCPRAGKPDSAKSR